MKEEGRQIRVMRVVSNPDGVHKSPYASRSIMFVAVLKPQPDRLASEGTKVIGSSPPAQVVIDTSGVPVPVVSVPEHFCQDVVLGIADLYMKGSPVIAIVGHDVVTE
jgi:hypothetical protein